jgi:hypothetical protein
MQISEEWRPVVGYDGLYEVSSLGRIRSLDRLIIYADGKATNTKGRIIKEVYRGAGYNGIGLHNKKQRTTSVHTIVAKAFHGTHPGKNVNHINGIKTDNRACNLEWTTPSENSRHAISMGLYKQKRGTQCALSLFTDHEVRQMRNLITLGLSQSEIGRMFGITQASIYRIIHRIAYIDVR